ncbi:MAG: DUF3037 domain-containing protein, partial [Bacteroidia bacterium]|nr:DUF3037 domain-containing protein [Bacteroidia bacterium]
MLNEVVNIGLLIILPEENKIQFFFPRALERLSSLYQDLSVSQIKKYLKAFKRKSEELNEGFEELVNKYEGFKDYHSVKRIIKNYFLIQDASSLYFGDVKSGLDGHSIVKEIKELYFSPYSKPTRISRKDENYLEDTFIKGLSQKVFNKTKYDKYTNRNFKVSSGIITQEFPFAWKNGHTNII